MALRYWVGGAGNWSSTTKWSSTSGGASGASVPTAADDVIFDANSGGKFTATVDSARTVNSITITPSAATGVLQIALSAQLTTGNLTVTGTSGNNRVIFRSTYDYSRMFFTVNGTVNITDCDFKGLDVRGSAAPISGTRIGNCGSVVTGVTFSAAKTVYFNFPSGESFSSNVWAATSGGAVSTDNFPLGQDTVIIDDVGLNSGATFTLDSLIPFIGTLDVSSRTLPMTLAGTNFYSCTGDWKLSSSVSYTRSGALTFVGDGRRVLSPAGKSLNHTITVYSVTGGVVLDGALTTNLLGVFGGIFDTSGYSVTCTSLNASSNFPRYIYLRSSTVTSSGAVLFGGSESLTLDSGTSTIAITAINAQITATPVPLYNLAFTSTTLQTATVSAASGATFNNVSFVAPVFESVAQVSFNNALPIKINGTLSVSGAEPNKRLLFFSDVHGTPRTLEVNSLSVSSCDFRDITLTGSAAGTSVSNGGDCTGNTGIVFPAPKTVYWNLSGTQSWLSDGWASTSGGTPNLVNYPLPQDTAVFDDAGAVGSITLVTGAHIGTFNAAARTTAMTLRMTTSGTSPILGDFTLSSAVTFTSTTGSVLQFVGNGTSTITTSGVTIETRITVERSTSTSLVQLGDSLTLNTSSWDLYLNRGAFFAGAYNVTMRTFPSTSSQPRTLRLGSGTWTLAGTGTVWNLNASNFDFDPGTATILLSSTATTARTFAGNSYYYHKLVIGGVTGTSTLTVTGNNTFGEFASIKTVAHTISFSSAAQKFGKWTITGSFGNSVTVSSTSTNHELLGPATSGLNYLSMGSTGFNATTSMGEFYAGPNSTGSNSTIIKTNPPAARTLYWVGGTGNWSSTTKWSTTSGGAGGAAVPTSLDDVVFNSSSSASSYTSTIDTTIRCKSLTVNGPASGTVTIAGTAPFIVHDGFTLASTGVTWSHSGGVWLSGTGAGKVFTTNGKTIPGTFYVNGVGAEWSLGSALTTQSPLNLFTGSFSTNNYTVSTSSFQFSTAFPRAVSLGSSAVTLSNVVTPLNFGTTYNASATLSFDAGTSSITCSGVGSRTFYGNNQTFYNVTFSGLSSATMLINVYGANTYNNFTVTAPTLATCTRVGFTNDQVINGTFTVGTGSNSGYRVAFYPLFTSAVTLTCNAVSTLQDVDFKSITIAGNAVSGGPVSGTRLGNAGGNSGISFDAPKTVYWVAGSGAQWNTLSWAFTAGGAASYDAFPLPQDTAVITSTAPSSGSIISISLQYNVGTIDMSARTSNTLTFNTGTFVYVVGSLTLGTGVTVAGTNSLFFIGDSPQTITSAGRSFTQPFTIGSVNSSVTLLDALSITGSSGITFESGTFDANGYNVTLGTGTFQASSGTDQRTLAIGSGTWTVGASGAAAWNTSGTNVAITGTGTISLTSASAKTFTGGNKSYDQVTLNQGGLGALTISGNNFFKDITATYTATGATSILLGTTIQTLSQFTGTGTPGNLLTLQGGSITGPAGFVLTSGKVTTVDYLTVTYMSAASPKRTWYAGANSTNNGTFGWYFEVGYASSSFIYFGDINATSIYYGSTPVTAIYYGSTQVF